MTTPADPPAPPAPPPALPVRPQRVRGAQPVAAVLLLEIDVKGTG